MSRTSLASTPGPSSAAAGAREAAAVWILDFCVRAEFARGWRRAVSSATRRAAIGGRREGRSSRWRSRSLPAMSGWARRERWRALTMPRMGRTAQGKGTVTRVAGDGSVRRAAVDAAGSNDAARWQELIGEADLGVPPPYRPRPGEVVYQLRGGGLVGQAVGGSTRWLRAQVFCTIPEQVFLSLVPGQAPLSRWIAQMDRKFMPLAWAKFSIACASVR